MEDSKDVIVNITKIKEYLGSGNLSAISRDTKIPLRTLEDIKAGRSKWLEKVENRLVAIQDDMIH